VKVIVIGTGTIGSAVAALAADNGHDVLTIGRSSGDHQVDITDTAALRRLFSELNGFDAIAVAAGEVFSAPLAQTTDDQWADSIASKAMGQINVVRTALPFINDAGSFTLVSGILSEEVTSASTLGATINSVVEGFVRSAATELQRDLRINCISPGVLTESTDYHQFFPGFEPVPAARVALAYVRAMSNPYTGRILKLHNADF
jgi:NAD(P)-dependent dehydrogenase (short-subunit alcohol dehydrogenase family)